jgi:hypothetical protein
MERTTTDREDRDQASVLMTNRMLSFIPEAEEVSLEEASKQAILTSLGYYDQNRQFKRYPIWKTTAKDLEIHGVGLRLFFELIKQLIYLFIAISILSLYLIKNNIQSSDNYKNSVHIFLQTTIANQYEYPTTAANATMADTYNREITENVFYLWLVDIIISSSFIVTKV